MGVEYMSAEEIRREYAEAKDKTYQLQVLADMNFCSVNAIKRIISGETDTIEPPADRRGGGNKLTDEEQREIIRLHLDGMAGKEIAEKTGRSATTVCVVLKAYKNGAIEYEPSRSEISSIPMADLTAAEIADKLMTLLMNDLSGYIVEIKASEEDYTVRVYSEDEEVVHRKRYM